ncbi:PLP-dependent aminotransferase family protein [Gluconobacter oxydans]|uniref:MocR-like pyridoxine biosynthesis transcription factor PdxR n=1 Tax=Gluconobacter oxydans TaxID=442 RepID=UPI0039ED0F14
MLRPWRMHLDVRLDNESPLPIYIQIANAIVHDIERGRLAPGEFLPSTRAMAKLLSVNRKTIVLAYDELIAQGWIESAGTSGTKVSEAFGLRTPAPEDRMKRAPVSDTKAPFYDFRHPPARPLAVLNEKDTHKIDEGSPDGRLFPADVLARAFRTAMTRLSRNNTLSYGDPRGSRELREVIADMLKTERGLPINVENVCLTRGSQHGIFLAALTLLRPGDTVVVEDLTYEPAVMVFRAIGARVVSVGLDEDGVDVEALSCLCERERVSLVFLTPHHQFPTTVSLRPERRLHLIELARRHRFAILEDDYDHEFHFHSQPLLPMASYAPENVIYVGSLSKLVLPALRLGYIVAPAPVIEALAHHVSVLDGMGSIITETAVSSLIQEGELRRHARKAARIYAGRRDAFAVMLHEIFGQNISFTKPQGGLAFWVRFVNPECLQRIETNATSMNLRFAPSESYSASGRKVPGLRIGFASMNETEARQVLLRMGKASNTA